MAQTWRCWFWKLGQVSFVVIGYAIATFGDCALAQVTPDGTLPNNSIVTPQGNTSLIEGGTQAGSNLFHSFEQFSIPTGGQAIFNNALDIQNIISRVTGESISNIDGLIRANGIANLFLLNPNGIIFGPNSRLDIGGSFVATTANAIQFGNQGFFSASNPEASSPLLTVNPSALLFNQIAAASIQSNSVAPSGLDPSGTVTANGLRVPNGQSLLLVGGNVSIDGGRLFAFGGRVELGGLAGSGTVGLNGDGKNLSLSFPDGVGRSDVSLTNRSRVNVRADKDGSIAINARNVEFTGESALLAGIAPGLGSVNSKAGNIEVNAQAAVNFKGGSFVSNALFPGAIGKSGDVSITTGSLSLTNGSQANAGTDGRGDGGKVTITAWDTVSLDGEDDQGYPSGVLNGAGPDAVGKGGDVSITTGSLSVTNGAKISASSFGNGGAGSITITAWDAISFDGVASDGPSGTFSSVIPGAVGNGGSIRLTTNSLSLTNGAQLSVNSDGQGTAGDIEVGSRSIRLDNQAGILAGTASGNGGNITLGVQDLLLLRRSSEISTTAGTAQAGGDGGNITINAPDGFIVAVPGENNDITANAFTGSGGRVQINSFGIFGIEQRSREDLVSRLGNNDPTILDPQLLPTNDITAISQTSPTLIGVVNINTPDVDPSQRLINSPSVPVDTEVSQVCQAGAGQNQSQFIITGRGGLPPNPRQVLRSNAVQVDWVELDASRENRSSTKPATNPTIESANTQIVEANGWMINDKGEVVLTASAPTTTRDIPWMPKSGCNAPEPKS